jgi:hypothetical protein
VFGRELYLPCDLLFGVPPDKEQPIINHVVELVNQLHNIHNYACQHLKLVTDQMKTLMTAWPAALATGRAIKCGRITQITQKGSHKNFKPYGMPMKVTGINVVTDRIQWNPRTKTIVVHLD